MKIRSKLKLKFIFITTNRNMSQILNGFDIDIVQVGFTGKQVLCTLAFFQAARTKSFIKFNYKLTNDIRDVGYYFFRCMKYLNRSFK